MRSKYCSQDHNFFLKKVQTHAFHHVGKVINSWVIVLTNADRPKDHNRNDPQGHQGTINDVYHARLD